MTNVYNNKTLNGNWMEERAKPLKGVMVDYGYRLYGTTQQDAFPFANAANEDPALTRAAIMKSRGVDAEGATFSVTQRDNCLVAQTLAVPPDTDSGFLTRRPAPSLSNAGFDQYATTYRTAERTSRVPLALP